MPLGDSITQADSDHNSYRRELFRNLDGAGFAVDFVGSLSTHFGGDPPRDDFDRDHEGHWGFTVDEILLDLERWARDSTPDIVLIHLGSNDVFRGDSVESTTDELARIVDVIQTRNPDAVFLIAQIIPTDSPDVNRRIRTLNDAIASLVSRLAAAGVSIELVDQHTGFDAATMTYDGVHPNLEGEQRMAARWFDGLRNHLPNP